MKMNKFIFLLLSLTAVILITCTENHVLPNLGSLTITSDPTGADVFIDNKKEGITPYEDNDLLDATYSITLKQNEFVDTTFSAVITDNSDLNYDIFMKEIDPKGKITITSNPLGASIFLNNISTGEKTPHTFENLERGLYNISLRLNLYDNANFQVNLDKDATVEQNTNLVIASSAGSMQITSDPLGAVIFIDDVSTGKVTPSNITPLSIGEHSVKLTRTNYQDTSFTIQVSEGQQLNYDIFMLQENPQGTIVLTSEPSGASIFINEENSGLQTPATLTNLQRGSYNISLRLALYDNEDFQIELQQDEIIERNTVFNIASDAGILFIESEPSGAFIFIDDNNSGKVTPDTVKPLTPGDHEVRLTLDGYKDTTFTVNTPSGELISKNILLKAVFIINVEVNPENGGTVTGAGAYVQGDIARLEAFPTEGYNFVNWTENGSEVSTETKLNIIANDNRTIVANFELKQYLISAITNPQNSGIINGVGIYKHNDQVDLLFQVNDGYQFQNWTENEEIVSEDINYRFIATSDRNLVANSNPIGNLVINSDPAGAEILINNNPTSSFTPHTFENLVAGEYEVTLKLEHFADTTVIAQIFAGETTTLDEVFLKDITPEVDFDISFELNVNNQIVFSFLFNQPVQTTTIRVRLPNDTLFPILPFTGTYMEGIAANWVYPEKINGSWEFTFTGNKINGRGSTFSVNKGIQVD